MTCSVALPSLRYSDVRNLREVMSESDHIEVTTVKTADNLSIELNKYSKAILEKYKDIHFENDMVLPVINNQKMNDYLKRTGRNWPKLTNLYVKPTTLLGMSA